MADRVRCCCSSPERMKPRNANSSQIAGMRAKTTDRGPQARRLRHHLRQRGLDQRRNGKERLDDRPQLIDQGVECHDQRDRQQEVMLSGQASRKRPLRRRREQERHEHGRKQDDQLAGDHADQARARPPGAPGTCIKNQVERQDQGKAQGRLAAGRHRLAVAEHVPEPGRQAELLGLAEQDVLALKLVDRPAQRHRRVDQGRHQHRQEKPQATS